MSHLRIKIHRLMLRPLQSLSIVWVLTSAMLLPAAAQQLPPRDQKLKAPTPPMGWNSWDSYGETITEAQVRANADWMAKHLKQFGWQYVVIDEGWYVANPGAKPEDVKFSLDDNGRFIPVVDRFPSAADGAGFKPLADYVHSLGLKFGIHILRGIPREAAAKNLPIAVSPYTATEAAVTDDTCPWNTFMYGVQTAPSGQAYYNSIAQLYASWGVDFIKADCISDHPYKIEEIYMLSLAILFSGREMVLSLSPGPTALDKAGEVSPLRGDVAHRRRFLGPLGTTARQGQSLVAGRSVAIRLDREMGRVSPAWPMARRRHATHRAYRTASRRRRPSAQH